MPGCKLSGRHALGPKLSGSRQERKKAVLGGRSMALSACQQACALPDELKSQLGGWLLAVERCGRAQGFVHASAQLWRLKYLDVRTEPQEVHHQFLVV